jgi:hypothetical protein
MWNDFIDLIANPHAPLWFCMFMFAIFFFSLGDVWVRTTGLTHVLRRGINLLNTTDGPRGFFRDYESLRDHFVREPVFAGAWKEFDKTLVMDRNRDVVMITRRPHEFFHEVTLLSPRINLRLTNALPGYLISLGLFFTFIGLVAAISIAASGLANAGKISDLQQSLVQLLQVASLKFITSVMGISLSLVLSATQKLLLNNVSRLTYQFCGLMESRTQLITVEQLMFDWITAQHETTRKFQHMADDIAAEVSLKLVQPAQVA